MRALRASLVIALAAAIVLAAPARGSDTINLNTGEVTEISTFTASGGNTDKGLVQINAGGDYSVNLPTRTMRAWATATLSGKSETAAFMSTKFSVARGTRNQASGQVRIELTGINYSGTLSALGASTALYKLTMKVSQTPPVSGNPEEEITISQGSATALSTKSFNRSNGTSHVDMTVLAGKTYEVRIDLIVGAAGANLVSNAIADFNNDNKKVSVGAVRLTVLNATLPVSGPGRPK